MTSFVQRRFRDPDTSSWAFFLIPSATYVISEKWNFSLGVDFERRGFDPVPGLRRAGLVPRADRHARVRAAEFLVRR